ncbi:MAG: glycosyltransferase [Acetobacteraceae bacterium]
MTVLAALALLAWAWLLAGHGRFWQAGPVLVLDPAPPGAFAAPPQAVAPLVVASPSATPLGTAPFAAAPSVAAPPGVAPPGVAPSAVAPPGTAPHTASPRGVASPGALPAVTVVVPARDEAAHVAACLRSLLAQDYPGPLGIILVDDGSTDGTGATARAITDPRLTVIAGTPRPAGWSGKLWAVAQGIEAAGEPGDEAGGAAGDPTKDAAAGDARGKAGSETRTRATATAGFVLLTDADIVHDPHHVAALVARAERDDLDLVSELVQLACASLAERALIPAFVFFFQLLYPFVWVNDPLRATAAAAGGTILLRRRALCRIGGIGAVRAALIDDVALARAVKRGGRIWLGHSVLARSERAYPGFADIWRMIARTAYVQLRASPVLLVLTVAAMGLVWLVPPLAALAGHGAARVMGALAWAGMAWSYLPALRRFHLSLLWAPALPLVAAFYLAATLGSAWNHYSGRGVAWKGRAYGGGAP